MTSTFPDLWKISEVIPLLKEGDHEIASNNRPLSPKYLGVYLDEYLNWDHQIKHVNVKINKIWYN